MISAVLAAVLAAAAPDPAATLAAAARALGEGDFPTARQAAQGVAGTASPEVKERARLIEGIAARALGDFEAARRALDFPGGHLGALEAYHLLAQGDARFYAGDPAGAVEPFTRARDLARLEPFAARASGRLGDALLASGQPCPAAEAFKQHLAIAESPERLDALARAQSACGDAKGAHDTAHRLWLAFAEHPAAMALDASLGASAAPEDHLTRASRLLVHAGAASGLAEAVRGLAQHPRGELLAKLEVLRAKALAELKERTEADQALQQAVRAAPTSDAAAEAQNLLARAAWRRGDLKAAEARFGAVSRRRDRFGDDAAFLVAFMPLDRGEFARAVPRFEDYLKKRPSGRRADEAEWFIGYAALRTGDRGGAHQSFELLTRRFPGSPLVPQALYWQARTGPAADAPGLYRRTIDAAPLSYYAGLSRMRLAELGLAPAPALPRAQLPAPPRSALVPAAELARDLSEVGLYADRGEALDVAIRSTPTPDGALQLAALCASLGEWGRAYAVANARLWHKAFEEKNPAALALLYPRAYPELVERSCDAFGLDPSFAWAIMRRESAFDPRVESPARAVGLMQMLTPTAQKIAGLLGQQVLPDAAHLHQPEVAVPLAVWYLAELAGRFDHAALTAAAYNAGPKNLAPWLEKNGSLPFDEFVEAIPFRETRLYVKNVVGDALAYRALYGPTPHALPVGATLPAPLPGADF